jgi:hypothetical protein
LKAVVPISTARVAAHISKKGNNPGKCLSRETYRVAKKRVETETSFVLNSTTAKK